MTSRPARVEPIYLDFAASATPEEEVVEAMLPWLKGQHANPHADNWHGQRAARAIEEAREAIATLIGGDPQGVIFTSGATEANNMALKGLLGRKRQRLWLSCIEHKSILEPARALEGHGVEVTLLAVDDHGRLLPSQVDEQLRHGDGTLGLVAVGHGNNEIGTIQDVAVLARIAHTHGHLMHVDASQTAGHGPLAAIDDELDLVCLSSHKMYGPAGIGALYIAPSLIGDLRPLLHGGGQQYGIRSGTVAPFLAVGFGVAAKLAYERASDHRRHMDALVSAFLRQLEQCGIAFCLLGHPTIRLPGHLSIQLPGVSADDVLTRLMPNLSASTGAACQSGELRASHVLRAMGMSEADASQVVRISFGRPSLLDQAKDAAMLLAAAVSSALVVEMTS
jgi:cysteine desulfurase